MENILVVGRPHLESWLGFNGLRTENLEEILSCINTNIEFMPRPLAEENPAFKQIISYVIIRRGDEVFSTRRLSKGGEKRLHGLISLGIGGHINAESDEGSADILAAGMRRELEEEVALEGSCTVPRFCGIINDDSNEVGRVHLGMFYIMDTDGEVTVRETEKLEGSWLPIRELGALADQLETWSQIVAPAIDHRN